MEGEENGSYGDLLMDVLVTICCQESLWPSLACIFHMVSPHVSSFSLSIAVKVVALFKTIITRQRLLAPLILEGFASVVQQADNADNGFVLVLVQRSTWLKKLKLPDQRSTKALAILKAFLKSATKAMKATKRTQFMSWELPGILRNVRVPEGERHTFAKSPHSFGGEMEETWTEWTSILFVRSFKDEMQELRAFQNEHEPTLLAALAKVGTC
jgi:hypothetical protein